jgi:hypothetical protein
MASVEKEDKTKLKRNVVLQKNKWKKKKNYNCTCVHKEYHYNSGNTKCDKLFQLKTALNDFTDQRRVL